MKLLFTFLRICVEASNTPLYLSPPFCRRDLIISKGNENAAAVNPAINDAPHFETKDGFFGSSFIKPETTSRAYHTYID